MAQALSFVEYLGRGFKALPFKKEAVTDLRDDTNGKRNAFITITIVALLVGILFAAIAGVLGTFMGPEAMFFAQLGAGLGFVVGFILAFIGGLISCGVIHLCAKVFGGKATIMQYFSAYQSTMLALGVFGLVAQILGMIPFLGLLIVAAFGIYSIIFDIFVVRETYELSTGRAIGAVLLPVAIIFVFFLVVIGILAYFGVLRPSTY